MVEMLSKMMSICGVDKRGAVSGKMPERACIRKLHILSISTHACSAIRNLVNQAENSAYVTPIHSAKLSRGHTFMLYSHMILV